MPSDAFACLHRKASHARIPHPDQLCVVMTSRGEPSTLFPTGHGPAGTPPDDRLTSAERRERAALWRVGLWGVVLGTASVLLLSALLGVFPWV